VQGAKKVGVRSEDTVLEMRMGPDEGRRGLGKTARSRHVGI
jgi:hypothetical protein